MPKRLKKCIEIECNNKTNGLRCLSCVKLFKKPKISREEYARNWALKKKYSIDSLEFEGYWIAFLGKCGICSIDMKLPEKRKGQSLNVVAVDHCHKTGNVRGLLCNACNKGLGLFRDNPVFLKNAAKWLGG